MPKQAKSSTAKVRQICQEYPDEFSATPARDLRCNLCDVLVKYDKKFFVESHRKSKQHQRKLETKSKSQSKQTFLQLDQVNFKEQVVPSFLLLLITRPLPRDGGMVEDHGAPEARQLPRVWTRGRTETESRQRVSGAKRL